MIKHELRGKDRLTFFLGEICVKGLKNEALIFGTFLNTSGGDGDSVTEDNIALSKVTFPLKCSLFGTFSNILGHNECQINFWLSWPR